METGILRPGQWGYALETDGGGMWQLDLSGSARHYLGRRVTVEGRRSGFDLLDVHRIWPVGPQKAGFTAGRRFFALALRLRLAL